jgi:hypothetical protein
LADCNLFPFGQLDAAYVLAAVEDSEEKEIASDVVESGSMEEELEMAKINYHAGVHSIDQNRNSSKELSPITPSFLYTGYVYVALW